MGVAHTQEPCQTYGMAEGTHYPESIVRSMLGVQPWVNRTRRVIFTINEYESAWTPRGNVDGPRLITWVQNADKSIDAIVTH